MAELTFKRRPGRRRKKGVSFDPNKEFLDNAKNEFIKNGGKITKIEPVDNELVNYIKPYRSPSVIDLSILD
mgnify:FL=1|jgi:hypothetical protein